MSFDAARDVRDMLGMRTVVAKGLAVWFSLACVIMAFAGLTGVTTVWPLALAVLVCVGAGWTLVLSDGDPMPLPQACALSCTGAVSCGAVFMVAPVPVTNPAQLWTFGMSTIIFTLMCVRGRVGLAWVGVVLMLGVSMVWASLTGQGILLGFSISIINVAPVVMATFFALTLRPLAASIFELRRQSTRRIAEESAASALLEERDAQLDRLDELARPLLERIASGVELSSEGRLACALLEARLRDGLRAPGLQQNSIVEAARAARERGVEVVLLDDYGLAQSESAARERLTSAMVAELESLSSGTVTMRILPPGRRLMATILVDAGDGIRRLEFGHDGRVGG